MAEGTAKVDLSEGVEGAGAGGGEAGAGGGEAATGGPMAAGVRGAPALAALAPT